MSLQFELPPMPEQAGGWSRWVGTSLASPADIVPIIEAPPVQSGTYGVLPRSLAVMVTGISALGSEPR